MEAKDIDAMPWSEEIFQKELIKVLLETRNQVYSLNEIAETLTDTQEAIVQIDETLHQIGLKLKEGIATFPQSE
jgi:alanine racemase